MFAIAELLTTLFSVTGSETELHVCQSRRPKRNTPDNKLTKGLTDAEPFEACKLQGF